MFGGENDELMKDWGSFTRPIHIWTVKYVI